MCVCVRACVRRACVVRACVRACVCVCVCVWHDQIYILINKVLLERFLCLDLVLERRQSFLFQSFHICMYIYKAKNNVKSGSPFTKVCRTCTASYLHHYMYWSRIAPGYKLNGHVLRLVTR